MAKKRRQRGKQRVNNRLGKTMFALRNLLGISMQEAADRIGVSQRTWVAWEYEGKTPTPSHLKLIEAFCTNPGLFPKR